ncbi:MAG: hypothetical protein WBP12_04225 [Candidatus Saccharimonas sp.]
MNNQRKRMLIIIIILVVITIVTAAIYFTSTRNQTTLQGTEGQSKGTPPPLRTKDELLAAILKQQPSLKDSDGSSRVRVVDTPQRLDNNWYIIQLELIDVTTDHAKVLLYDSGSDASSIKLILGPGTSFPDDTFDNIDPPVPAIVRTEMNR